MNDLTVISWQSETSLSPYPLSKSIGFDNLLIDANFVQFDNFAPVLKSVYAANDIITFEILFDKLKKTISIARSSLTGIPYTVVIRDNTRYLGKLVLGPEASSLYDDLASRRFDLDVKFLSFLVKSIPSKVGVYSIDNLFGGVQFGNDANVFYQITGNNVTFNAVATPTQNPNLYLKTINGVGPSSNNFKIVESSIVKITGNGAGVVQFSLVGSSFANLLIDQNNTIPTNLNP